MYIVYKIINNTTQKIYWVGMTSQTLHKRLLAHKSQGPLKTIIMNINDISIIALQENIKSKKQAFILEEYYTVILKPIYNKEIANHISNNTKNKASQSLTHIKNPRAQKIKCITTGEIFDTINDTIKHFNISRSQFYKIVNGTANQKNQIKFYNLNILK